MQATSAGVILSEVTSTEFKVSYKKFGKSKALERTVLVKLAYRCLTTCKPTRV
jgi:hypothetical protein